MKRRSFIILTGLGAASTTMLGACGHPEEKLIPALVPDDEYVPGIDYTKPTTCLMCAAGCGIVVRTREHKANKIEGNPLHPINQGALCARGQAGLQVLYNPDRIKSPLRRKGDRGKFEFEEITWAEAIDELASRLQGIKAEGQAGSVVAALGDSNGVTGLVAESLMSEYGSKRLLDGGMFNEAWAEAGYEAAYQRRGIPFFDIARARYLLSFGARFLESWHSPVMYSLAYGQFRQASPRGKLVQVEPRMSLTGANADEWLPAAVGTEGLVALGIAQVMIREGLAPNPPRLADLSRLNSSAVKSDSSGASPETQLEAYAPEHTGEQTGIPAQTIIRIAREFAASQPALAIGWGSTLIHRRTDANASLESMKAIHFLNRLVGNENKPGGVLPAPPVFDPLARWRTTKSSTWRPLTRRTFGGDSISALLIQDLNLAHSAPWTADTLKSIPLIVSFSSFIDETAQHSDLILPNHSFLESWDIRASQAVHGGPAVSLAQPVVKPEFNTRQTADVLIELGRKLEISLRFGSAEELIRMAAGDLAKAPGSISVQSPEDFWTTFTDRGVWISEHEAARADNGKAGMHSGTVDVLAGLTGPELPHSDDGEYPFLLMAYEHAALGLGEYSNLPWLQELPDPMTSVMWGSWVEVNPRTAARLGIADGDLVRIETADGEVQAPAILYPAIRPEVIAMPYGQGHQAFGRYAAGRGVNAAVLSPIAPIPKAEALAVRARIHKADGEGGMIRFGTPLPERPELRRR